MGALHPKKNFYPTIFKNVLLLSTYLCKQIYQIRQKVNNPSFQLTPALNGIKKNLQELPLLNFHSSLRRTRIYFYWRIGLYQ